MKREYLPIINNTILSINSIKIFENMFSQCELILTDCSLNVLYIYRLNKNINLIPIREGDNVSVNFGSNAILLSSISKSIAIVKYEEHNQLVFNNLVSVCSPIMKENGEIIAYCALFIKGGNFENSMVFFIEILSKLLFEKLVNFSVFGKIKNEEIDFIDSLSSKEKEIVYLISQSFTDNEIADKLKISKSTVCSHLRTIFRKNNIFNRIGLITKYHYSLILNASRNIKSNLEYK